MTDLSNLDNFLLEADFQIINGFIGKDVLRNNPNMKPGKDVRDFISVLAKAIAWHYGSSCKRRCPLRKRRSVLEESDGKRT